MNLSQEKLKVLVLGDSGVGKSSLVHLICHNKPLTSTNWTIGCSIEIKLHHYKEGTVQQNLCFIEMWDVGGSRSHSITRKLFFNNYHGIILVQDLTNSKSESNLKNWLGQALYGESIMKDQNTNLTSVKSTAAISQALFPVSNDVEFEYDIEMFADLDIPVLIVATKQDIANDHLEFKSNLNDFLKTDFIYVNCKNEKSLAPGTTNAVKLSRFFDKVCDKKMKSHHAFNSSLDRLNVYQRQSSSFNLNYK